MEKKEYLEAFLKALLGQLRKTGNVAEKPAEREKTYTAVSREFKTVVMAFCPFADKCPQQGLIECGRCLKNISKVSRAASR